jgi:hypothetical protein
MVGVVSVVLGVSLRTTGSGACGNGVRATGALSIRGYGSGAIGGGSAGGS